MYGNNICADQRRGSFELDDLEFDNYRTLRAMAVDLHKYYFRYIVRIFGYIYVFFVFPEIKTA